MWKGASISFHMFFLYKNKVVNMCITFRARQEELSRMCQLSLHVVHLILVTNITLRSEVCSCMYNKLLYNFD